MKISITRRNKQVVDVLLALEGSDPFTIKRAGGAITIAIPLDDDEGRDLLNQLRTFWVTDFEQQAKEAVNA